MPISRITTVLAAAVGCLLVLGTLASRKHEGSVPRTPRRDALRIVSLAPSVTEILFALHAEDSLVGATDRCDFPADAARIERVGGFGSPNIETLLALSPDLVIASGLERSDTASLLQRSGIRVLDLQIRTFDELFEAIQKIGVATNSVDQAERIVAQMQDDIKTVERQHASPAPERRPRVFVEITDHPLITAGGVSFLDELIARAGGVNVAHELPQAYSRISPEKVIAWNPDVILVARMHRATNAAAELSSRIGWDQIDAIKKGRIISDIDPDLLFRPGPRLIDGVKALSARLHDMLDEPPKQAANRRVADSPPYCGPVAARTMHTPETPHVDCRQ
jgi:iron complex transport system substrate-binding protein